MEPVKVEVGGACNLEFSWEPVSLPVTGYRIEVLGDSN